MIARTFARLTSTLIGLLTVTPIACGSSSGTIDTTPDAAATPGADGGASTDASANADATDALSDAPTDGASPEDAGDAAVYTGPTKAATITVDPTKPLAHVDSTFAGLSYEKSMLSATEFSSTDAALIALYKHLGPSILRVGGNSVDHTVWTPTGAGQTAGQTAQADVDRLAAFARAVDWKVIYGVNMATSTPAVAADESAYAASSLGDRLAGIEIGNEPDEYHTWTTNPNYSYANFKTDWEAFDAAIVAKTPGIVLTGPASAARYAQYTIPFASDEASRIALLTQHFYIGDAANPTSTIAKLLAPDPNLMTELAALRGAKFAGGFRFAEANSFYNGGANDVSNTFASALWVIDLLFTIAEGGARGANFHTGNSTKGYSPIARTAAGFIAQPEYYGIFLFAQAAGGDHVAASTIGGSADWSAYAVEESDGSTAVIVNNRDATMGIHATIDVSKGITSATQTALRGPSLDALSGLTLAGALVNGDGSWTPGPLPSLNVTGQQVVVDVAPASAVLIRAK